MADVNLKAQNGIVVMLDALGVRDYDIKQADIFYNKIIEMVDMLKPYKAYITDSLKSIIGTTTIEVKEPKIITFGDTVLIHWENVDNSFEELDTLILLMGMLLVKIIPFGLKNNILWRGAIGVGEYYVSNTSKATILGPAVKDVVSYYEKVDWIGIVCTPQCGYLLEGLLKEYKISKIYPYCNYNVPLKTKDNKMWAVNWIFEYADISVDDYSEGNIKDLNRYVQVVKTELLHQFGLMSIPVGTENKYKNTIKFMDKMNSEIQKKYKKGYLLP